jgi:hypothetical protein
MLSHTKPGGYVELADVGTVLYSDDNSLTDDNPMKLFSELMSKGWVYFFFYSLFVNYALIALLIF